MISSVLRGFMSHFTVSTSHQAGLSQMSTSGLVNNFGDQRNWERVVELSAESAST